MTQTKLDTILFDLDGTLLDTAPDLATALNVVLERHQRPTLSDETIRPYASAGTRGLLGLGFQISEDAAEYGELREQFLQAYHDHIKDRTAVFPGILSVLSQIEATKLRWGVVTNKPESLAFQLLDHFNLSSRCACLVGGDTLSKRKPDPDQLFYACEQMQTDASRTVYVGDAARDIEAAKRANMVSIAALYGYINSNENPQSWEADYYLESPQAMLDWLSLQTHRLR